MQDTLHATNLDTAATGQLVVTAMPGGTTQLSIRRGPRWHDLLDIPDAEPVTLTTEDIHARSTAGTVYLAEVGPLANDLDSLPDATVVRTESGWFFQKAESRWWRMAETWTGDACAIPATELLRREARVCWTPTAP